MISSLVLRNEYRDSLVLLSISEQLKRLEGVQDASVMMATPNNKQLIRDAGMMTPEIEAAGSNDLVIVVKAQTLEQANEAIASAKRMIMRRSMELKEEKWIPTIVYNSLSKALDEYEDSNIVTISIPGRFVAREAMRALKNGKHVIIFSDKVPIQQEAELKKFAQQKGLLVLGPECGTVIIDGVGFFFANLVNRGPIGIVGNVGTGVQQISVLLNNVGISHAISTGANDLSPEVGGISTRMVLKMLSQDPDTKLIILVSKPGTQNVVKDLLEDLGDLGKPLILSILGSTPEDFESVRTRVIHAKTLEEAALKAMKIIHGGEFEPTPFSQSIDQIKKLVEIESENLKPSQKYIRGLYSGGTLCSEAMIILKELVGDIYSNVPLRPELMLEDWNVSKAHTCIDMGTGFYTLDRPHPMIDFKFRRERILREAQDPEVAVILLDVILGLGAHPDPAGELAPVIAQAKQIANEDGRHLSVVASICGTDRDPQGLQAQREKLQQAGVLIMPSNAQAARLAALIATRGQVWEKL